MTLSISNSEMQSYKRCKRKWYLSYYLQRGQKNDLADLGARNVGTKVHAALELWYASHGDPVAEITRLYNEDIEKWPNEAIEIGREKVLAVIMVEGYMQWLQETGADEHLEITDTEQTVEVQSPVPGVMLRGRLDARAIRKTDGVRVFIDHKTKPSFTGLAQMLPLDEQTKLYQLLEHLSGDREERTGGAIYNVLRRVKRTAKAIPPFYDRIPVHHNNATLQSMWLRVQRVIEEIVDARQKLDAGGDHRYLVYPSPDLDCSWKCPFILVCPMMDDGSNWQGLLEEHYPYVDPYERYKDEMAERVE